MKIARLIIGCAFDRIGQWLYTTDPDNAASSDNSWEAERFPAQCPQTLEDMCRRDGEAMLIFWGSHSGDQSASGYYPMLPVRPRTEDINYLPTSITALVAYEAEDGFVDWGYSIRCETYLEAHLMVAADSPKPVIFQYDEASDSVSYHICNVYKEKTENGT